MTFPQPTAQVLAGRARIASLVSSIRPLRLRTSVFDLTAHRIPTLWTLYRGLLRNSPTNEIRWRIEALFRRDKSMRKAVDVRDALRKYHRWNDIFAAAQQGDTRLQRVLERYSRMISAKKRNDRMAEIVEEEVAWIQKLRNRPILTGSYVRPSFFNGPLPRMKPFPIHVGALIHKRRVRRGKRIEELGVLRDLKDDLAKERDFEAELLRASNGDPSQTQAVFTDHFDDWDRPITSRIHEILQTFKRDDARARMPYPPQMLAAIKAARREKVENKTRELERERRGAVLKRTLLRRRKGPPAHVLATMSAQERHMDKVSRSVSEVGYVGQVKRALGFRLRNPEAWKAEIGRPEEKERLDRMMHEISAENRRRRQRAARAAESVRRAEPS